jgi:ubiquinone/menaquinone biosynthesis C-methylase UbiE
MDVNLRNRQDADQYDRVSSQQFGPWDRLLLERAIEVRPIGARRPLLLDVGAGTGVILLLLARAPEFAGFRFIGYEFFEDMVAKGQERVEGAKDVRIRMALGDAHDLPHENDSVDMVISRATLHHLRDKVRALRETMRVLKPGGVALFHDARRDAPAEVLETFNAMRMKVGYNPTTLEEKLTLSEAGSLLEQAGLTRFATLATGDGLGALGFEIVLRKSACALPS